MRILTRQHLLILLTLTGLLAAVSQSKAQNLVSANPAEMYDFKSAFVNPAIYSFQDAHVALGAKIFHLGFVENQASPFRQGLVSVVLPFALGNFNGIGLQAQYFNTPLFSQSNISVGLTRRLKRGLAIGFKVNVFSRAFNSDKFDLVDADDPVFANGTVKWNATFGFGVTAKPFSSLTLGLAVDHINRVDISLNAENFYQPLKTYVGALWDLGLVQASVSASYEDGKFLPKITIGSFAYQKGYVRLGYNERAAQFEGQLHLNGPLSLNYTYEFTLFDHEGVGVGSHQFTLIHQFDRKRKLPEIELPDEFVLSFEPPDKPMKMGPRFYINPTADKLEIVEKRVRRVIGKEIDQETLAQLSKFGWALLKGVEQPVPFERVEVDSADIPASVDALYSEQYQSFLKQLSRQLDETGRTQIYIISPEKSILRAAGLKSHFAADSSGATKIALAIPRLKSPEDHLQRMADREPPFLLPEETVTTYSPQATTFRIVPVVQGKPIQKWQFIVEDHAGQIVRQFEGLGPPQDELVWDWRNSSGELLKPGLYSYYLQWQDLQNRTFRSEKQSLLVQKLVRNITIEVTKKPKKIGGDTDEIDILLKP